MTNQLSSLSQRLPEAAGIARDFECQKGRPRVHPGLSGLLSRTAVGSPSPHWPGYEERTGVRGPHSPLAASQGDLET